MAKTMSAKEAEELKARLNKLYDDADALDIQIDLLLLKRKSIMNTIESGVAILIKYSEDDDIL